MLCVCVHVCGCARGNHTVAVHKHQTEIELVLACVGELNTILRNNVHWPLLYGAGNWLFNNKYTTVIVIVYFFIFSNRCF